MTDFHQLLVARCSTRKFADGLLTGEETKTILEAALLSPTSKRSRSWQFVVVEDRAMLENLSYCKPHGSKLISGAALAVVVLGNPLQSDVWIEDASIAAINMQLQAEDLGLGSCWVQIRERDYSETETSGEYVNRLLDIPIPLQTLCIIAFGRKNADDGSARENELLWENVHIGKYHLPDDESSF